MIDGVKEICYSFDEVIDVAKPNIASKLKNLARDSKDENSQGVKKIVKQGESRKKESTDGDKASGRKS